MKAAALVFLLAVSGAAVRAQNSVAPVGDVTIQLSAGKLEYCLGTLASVQWLQLNKLGQGPGDISLRLTLRLRYENHRSETIFLPQLGERRVTRMTVAGQSESTILRDARTGGFADKSLLSLASPEADFWTIAGHKNGSATLPKLSVLKFPGTVEVNDFVAVPVLVHSSGLDLRGKTVQIVTSRDFRSAIAPDVLETLNGRWKDRGLIWAGVAESDTLLLPIPEEPLTRDCRTP